MKLIFGRLIKIFKWLFSGIPEGVMLQRGHYRGYIWTPIDHYNKKGGGTVDRSEGDKGTCSEQ